MISSDNRDYINRIATHTFLDFVLFLKSILTVSLYYDKIFLYKRLFKGDLWVKNCLKSFLSVF